MNSICNLLAELAEVIQAARVRMTHVIVDELPETLLFLHLLTSSIDYLFYDSKCICDSL